MMLKNKVVVVTGGYGLLGQAFCAAVAEHCGIPIVADTNTEGEKFADSLNCADYYNMDITNKKNIDSCIVYTKEKYGRIDAIVNNAYPRNKNFGRHLFDIEFEDFCENTNLNIGGYFLVSQRFALFFINQGYGNIINISSIYGVIPPRFEIYEGTNMTMPVEYAAIKSAIILMTKYFAKYLKGKNIRVNTLTPGGIFDNQPDIFCENYKKFCMNKGMLNPTDLSNALIFLLSDLSKMMNGQNLIVDDGFTL